MPDAQAPAPLSPRRLKACSRLPHPPVGDELLEQRHEQAKRGNSNGAAEPQSSERMRRDRCHRVRPCYGIVVLCLQYTDLVRGCQPLNFRAQRGSRRHACRCRWEKVKTPLAKQGHVELKCEFCNRAFRYDDAQVGRSCAAR